jgi:hypothetical protein
VRDYRRLVLARVGTTVRTTMPRLGVEDRVGAENIHLPVPAAVRAGGGHRTTPG